MVLPNDIGHAEYLRLPAEIRLRKTGIRGVWIMGKLRDQVRLIPSAPLEVPMARIGLNSPKIPLNGK
jgi:hypothetical protein